MEFTTEKELATISSTDRTAKLLTLTSWHGNPAKLDLRAWRTEGTERKPGKGITLTDTEAEALLNALQAYFKGE